MKQQYTIQELREIIQRLRGENGCPWDREQTHLSLKNCMIEEAYEVIEGIDLYNKTNDATNLCEELGDVLLQVVMHSQIAEENDEFTWNDVVTEVTKKMITRHPHVFGNQEVKTSEEVLRNWEQIKQEEKNETSVAESMKRVPMAMPATMRACKVQKKAAKVGFDFENINQVIDKMYEELEELKQAMENADKNGISEEYGDLVFTVVNLSRFLQLNVENSLTNATDKFINRFVDVEKLTVDEGRHLEGMSIDELNALWGRVK